MIEKIKVTDVTVVGSIREAMPTATRQAKGLMPALLLRRILINNIYN